MHKDKGMDITDSCMGHVHYASSLTLTTRPTVQMRKLREAQTDQVTCPQVTCW